MTDAPTELLKLAERTCTVCQQAKPLSAFGIWRSAGKQRIYAKCRECKNAQNRDPSKRDQRRAYRRDRRASPKGDVTRKADRTHFANTKAKYPEKLAAKRLVRTAMEKGQLIRPATCEKCGLAPPPYRDGRSGIQAHHDDYSRPLDVRWLCLECHSKEHAK